MVIWKGLDLKDKGIIVEKTPQISKGKKRIDTYEIAGRDGFLTIDNGTYNAFVVSVECHFDNDKTNWDDVKEFLDGYGTLSFDGEREYTAIIQNAIPFDKIKNFKKFIIQFLVNPVAEDIEYTESPIDISDKTIIGENIQLNDAELKSLKMYKESSQHTTTGINLLPLTDGTYSSNGVQAIIKDGIITLSGTATSDAYINLVNNLNKTTSIKTTVVRNSTQDNIVPPRIMITINGTEYNAQTQSSHYDYRTLSAGTISLVRLRINTGENVDGIVIKPMIYDGEYDSSISWEPYTNGASPNPDYPQEVKTVKGYRNLFDGIFRQGSRNSTTTSNRIYSLNNFTIEQGKNYTISTNLNTTIFRYAANISQQPFPNSLTLEYDSGWKTTSSFTFTASTTGYFGIPISKINGDNIEPDDINDYWFQLTESNQELPYVPYGNNYVLVNISDGTNTNKVPIPLNNNEIAGKGDYLDELIVDETGHVYLNKKMSSIYLISDYVSAYNSSNNRITLLLDINTINNSNGLSNIATILTSGSTSSTYENKFMIRERSLGGFYLYAWLKGIDSLEKAQQYFSSNEVILYYNLESPQLIDLNTTVNLSLFEGLNNISNSEDANMSIRYVKDIQDLLS